MVKTKTMALALKAVKLENFKCFKSEKIFDTTKLTILTGANSSGKSSLFHAILGAMQSRNFPFNFSPNGKYINMGDFGEISNSHSLNNKIKIELTFEDDGTIHNISTQWQYNKKKDSHELGSLIYETPYSKLTLTKKEDYELTFAYDPAKDPQATPERKMQFSQYIIKSIVTRFDTLEKDVKKAEREKEIASIEKYAESYFKKVTNLRLIIKDLDNIADILQKKRNARLSFTIHGLMKQIIDDYDDNINAISSYRLHPNRTYLEKSAERKKIGKFGDGYLDQIVTWEEKKNPKLKELKGIGEKLCLFHNIQSKKIQGGRFEFQINTRKGGVVSSLADVGFGVSQFLPVLVGDLQLSNNSTLFVAEPEIHLHPNIQALYADHLVEQINDDKKRKNYFIETHSEYFLNRIRLAIVKGTLKESDLSIYYLENIGTDVEVHKITFGKRGQIQGAPKGFFETYMMDLKDIALSVDL